jgi:hypothetical protein
MYNYIFIYIKKKKTKTILQDTEPFWPSMVNIIIQRDRLHISSEISPEDIVIMLSFRVQRYKA